MTQIYTERLVLRPICEQDAPLIFHLGKDWDVCAWTSRMPYPYSPELALQWIYDLYDGEFVRGSTFMGQLVGLCGFSPCDEGCAEIGYWIGKQYWNQGFGTESAKAIVDYCFKKRSYRLLHAHYFTGNLASERIIKKLGFRYIDTNARWCEARRRKSLALHYILER